MTAPATPQAPPVVPRRCTFADVGGAFTAAADPALVRLVTGYFAQFCAPIGLEQANFLLGARCLCGAPLTGFCGTFRYGLAHGEGRCGACGHPGRADHYVRDDAREPVLTLPRYPLLYFPAETTPETTEARHG